MLLIFHLDEDMEHGISVYSLTQIGSLLEWEGNLLWWYGVWLGAKERTWLDGHLALVIGWQQISRIHLQKCRLLLFFFFSCYCVKGRLISSVSSIGA
jgi:hypothetical protein